VVEALEVHRSAVHAVPLYYIDVDEFRAALEPTP
jgi:hypothetical protein